VYKRILVPLDGSMQAEKALQPAVLLAKALSAELLLIRVVPALKSIAPTLEIPWQTQKAEKQ
jgi:nucleotide-binding universal stress UspA family protein